MLYASLYGDWEEKEKEGMEGACTEVEGRVIRERMEEGRRGK